MKMPQTLIPRRGCTATLRDQFGDDSLLLDCRAQPIQSWCASLVKDYNPHHPRPITVLAGDDRTCNPTHLENTKLKNTKLEDPKIF